MAEEPRRGHEQVPFLPPAPPPAPAPAPPPAYPGQVDPRERQPERQVERQEEQRNERKRPAGDRGAATTSSRGWAWTMLAVTWTVAGLLLAIAALVYVLDATGLVEPASLRQWVSSLLVFQDNSLAANIIVFIIAGVIVWMAGTKLSVYADVIQERTGLGRAFVGLLLLATATSLPEVATTITAGVIGNAQLLTGNLLGGIAMQTAILAVMDLLLVRRSPLTFFAPNPRLLIDGVMLVALLALVVVGMATDSAISFWGMGVTPIAIVVVFVLMLWTTHSRRLQPRWEAMNPPEPPDQRRREDEAEDQDELDGDQVQREEVQRYEGTTNGRLYLLFGLGALAILVAGYLLARTGDAIATQTGIGSTLIGAVLVAIGTSLPEISTTAKAVRLGAHSMAISNIFGSNAFCVALLFVGDLVYRDTPILQNATQSDVFLTALGMLVTLTYLWGMLERRDRTFLKMGVASFIVLVLYIGGLFVLYSILSATGARAGGGGGGGGAVPSAAASG